MNNDTTLKQSIFLQKVSTVCLTYLATMVMYFLLEVVFSSLKVTMPITSWNWAHFWQTIELDSIAPVASVLIASFFNFYNERFSPKTFFFGVGLLNLIGWSVWFAPYYLWHRSGAILWMPVEATLLSVVGAVMAWKCSALLEV